MSFAAPLVLLALLAVPLLIVSLRVADARAARGAAAFTMPALLPSVAPHRPGPRRWIAAGLVVAAVALLIVALAHPRYATTVPRTDGAVILADDVSSSMSATDVAPSRLAAARNAASAFIAKVPSTIRVGVIQFNQTPITLQSPTRDHAAARAALDGLHAGGHTAIGSAINTAITGLRALRGPQGKRVPGAIVLLSDGTSDYGADPQRAAATAAAAHIPVFTVSVGTPRGTISVRHGNRTVSVPVPVSPGQLQQIAQRAGGRSFSAADAGGLSAVYEHLARQLGHTRAWRSLTGVLAAAALALLVIAGLLSLTWFGRLA